MDFEVYNKSLQIFMNFSMNDLENNTIAIIETNETIGVLISKEQIFTLILPYSIIFLLAIIGNALVIITLSSNRRMRSVTNIFLLNLAVSDLLLGVFCMPFTLVGVLLKQFIFGSLMCCLISYLQAVSVGVSVWTLVVMSVERYYAICHPLKSRESRQTLSHAHRMIALVWISSLISMSPIAALSQLQRISDTGKYKCRETWPSELGFEIFTVFLDIVLLVVPLIIMSLTYSLIALTLKKTLKTASKAKNDQCIRRDKMSNGSMSDTSESDRNGSQSRHKDCDNGVETGVFTKNIYDRPKVTALRSNTDPLVAEARQRRVIKMLFVVVLEFFICWTPIYTINTIILYSPKLIYKGLGYNGVSFFHLLAFFSSCTNPITYCFMNSKFRESFLSLFKCKNTNSSDFTSAAFPSHMSTFHNRNSSKSQRTEFS